jgi:hypothetical protein
MIPKKIHYCWLSKGKMSNVAIKCISTWHKIMPEYEFILWDAEKFNVNSVRFVKQACEMRKWAFAADYIRLYAIFNEGGIYLDTDVYVIKSFNDFLHYDFFISLERDLTTLSPDSEYANAFKKNENPELINSEMKKVEGFGLQAAIFGGQAGNPFIKDCMNWYENNDVFLPDEKQIYSNKLIAPDVYAAIAQKYGFKYISGFQQLKNNMVILPSDHFPNHLYKTDNAYAVHICENSWTKSIRRNIIKKIVKRIKRINILRVLFGKKKYYNWEQKIMMGGEYKIL